ncbi:MAG: S1-C subfamily serine protease [Planctomycetota bacterium]|jgi:S1-C subfamily serine protease
MLPGLSSVVVTPLHYLESGRQSVRAYFDMRPELGEIADRSMAACVRLEVRVAQQGSTYSEVQGSGFLIAGGRYVLTSGHSLTNSNPVSIKVTLADGRAFDAKVVQSSFDEFASTNIDLALLRLDTEEELPSLEIGEPRSGDTVFVLGYPGKHGLNQAGLVVSGQAYSNESLKPLITVAVIDGASPIAMSPVAGSVPTGGMSGSPVVNSSGRAVGIFNQVVTTPGRDGVTYSCGASSSLEWWSKISKVVGQ